MQNLKDLINNNPDIIGIIIKFFVTTGIVGILKKPFFANYFFNKTTSRLNIVRDELRYKNLNQTVRSLLEDELNYLVFKRLTGISADSVLQNKINDVISKSGGELQIHEISRARTLLRMKEGRLQINLKLWHLLLAAFYFITSILVLLFALLTAIMPAILLQYDILKLTTAEGIPATIASYLLSLLFVYLAIFLHNQFSDILYAKEISVVINKLEQT